MEKIDIQNFNKYYLKNDGNATLARVGHVNAVIEEVNTQFENLENKLAEITNNVYADNNTAIAGGLTVGTLYSTTTEEVRIVV